jgi:hypothetical protein
MSGAGPAIVLEIGRQLNAKPRGCTKIGGLVLSSITLKCVEGHLARLAPNDYSSARPSDYGLRWPDLGSH